MTFEDFPGGLVIKNLPYNAGDKGLSLVKCRIPQAMGHRKIEKPACHMDDPAQQEKKKKGTLLCSLIHLTNIDCKPTMSCTML